MPWRHVLFVAWFLACGATAAAQSATRLSILQAEERRAPTARDLAILRAGARGRDGANARIAVRALGRLERPELISNILPLLRHSLPEVRAEAANAVGQAAEGWKNVPAAGVDPAARALEARLAVEDVAAVRAAIYETLGRLPYTPDQARRIERTLLDEFGRRRSVADRLGIADGLEVFVRRQLAPGSPSADLLAKLIDLATARPAEATAGARVRRLALEALVTTAAADDRVIQSAAADPDAQVRRLALRAAAMRAPEGGEAATGVLTAGLADVAPMVRLEAVSGLRARIGGEVCAALIGAMKDRDMHVNLMALDRLAACGASPEALAALERTVTDLSEAGSGRGWHRAAHALVALASATPERATAALPQFLGSSIWQLRMYAARAAASLNNRAALEKLAADANDNVCEAAIEGLAKTAGHAADSIFIAALARPGHQVQRAAAVALAGTSAPEAVPALKSALQRLLDERIDNSHDARVAIGATLATLGGRVPTPKTRGKPRPSDLNATDLRRLASPRARITIAGVGSFEIALFTREAPATVLRFARLAEAGYYNGLTFHRIVPNMAIQGGSPGANEYIGDAWFMRDEVGLWPHVRGAVGISTRGRDTGDAQIFINTVDNPRFDHEYTVFAQVLNGIELVDLILEGDVIDTIEIVP
ncbi:MAG: peptidylprolyl isomerase [Acidobacteria bacterium]|nr:peptidylprolyl isomerase [Acidobacteriota bacterium]